MKTVLAILLLIPIASFAAEPLNCASPKTQLDMNICAAQSRDRAELNLQRIESQYIERLDANQTLLFASSQQTWRQYRDALCKFEASGGEGGSAYPETVAGCEEHVINERIKYMQELSTCKEGNYNCPVW